MIQRSARLWLVATGTVAVTFKAVRFLGIHGTLAAWLAVVATGLLLLAVGFFAEFGRAKAGGDPA